jgi:hypothetical protein
MASASPTVDEVSVQPPDRVADLTFNEQVAGAFDDRVSCSVPQCTNFVGTVAVKSWSR